MTMKQLICVIIALFAASVYAQGEMPIYDWKATLKVVDDEGHPIRDAEVQVSYGRTNVIGGLSDANGMFIASHKDAVENLVFMANKTGYYTFRILYHKGRNYKFDKWNPAQTIILKKIVNPIPMYAKGLSTRVPVFNNPAGYDLMMGDWVAPYGKGLHADMFLPLI